MDETQVSPSKSNPSIEDNGESKDCHEVVKSSGVDTKRGNLCGEHQNRMHRRSKITIACQTDDTDVYSSLISTNYSRAQIHFSPRKDDSSSKPEGTLRLMIQNFRNMTDTVRGPGKAINGVPWKIMVMPRQHVVQKKGTQKCLGFFLQCCPDAYSDSWSCQAAAELRLISQKADVPNFTRKTNHVYTAKENDWGYSCFMTWADILDEAQGYIKDDKVILEVFVKAELPKNILTHDQFEKKIQDYMRLADMQSSRGLIDKAIEVNQSALKFCKDKDENCKTELECQKAKLIEMKLKQSIERIEKGKDSGKEVDEDGSNNLNALRQALTGNVAGTKKSNTSGKNASNNGVKKNDSNSPELDAKKLDDDRDEDGLKLMSDEIGNQHESCSSANEDEDSQEEFCDACLQERLETIIAPKENIETSESSVQTEAPIPRSPSQSPPKSTKYRLSQTKRRLSTGEMDRTSGDGDERTPSRWTSEREAELLDLITLESRASLDSIRDTLERLVTLAQDGDVPPGLELDLAQLKSLRADQLKQRSLDSPMDVIEIPVLQQTDVIDLGVSCDGKNKGGFKKGQSNAKILKQSQEECQRSSESASSFDWDNYTDDEYSLIQRAKKIVETRAQELVRKYSQLIEQSEATRLAETVKKVEKRMKDIEKQTMSCRKELADECDRHYKEEQKLIKNNKQLQTLLQQANEKHEKLNNQLKERKTEVKKLEKRLKSESQTSAENSELIARSETLEKEINSLQRRILDEQKRHQRESQSFFDTKKHLQQELSVFEMDVERLNGQLEDKTQLVRKAEHRFEQERRQANTALRESLERAKKAEVNLLEFKLEIGIKLLVRAQEDCQSNIKQLEEMVKRSRHPNEMETFRKFMNDWHKTREEIAKMISSSKSEFAGQIDAVKGGKQLAQLPIIEVAKPPPPPKTIMPQNIEQQQHGPMQQSFQHQSYLDLNKQQPAPIGARPMSSNSSSQPSTPLLSVNNGTVPLRTHDMTTQRMQTPPPQQQNQQAINGFSPWSDPLNNLAQSLLASRSTFGSDGFGPVCPSNGWSDSWSSSAIPVSNSQSNNALTSNTLYGNSSCQRQQAGQWGVGWGYQQVTSAPQQPHSPPTNMQEHKVRSQSRGTAGSPSGQGMMDSRGSSPITAQNERHKRFDVLMSQLRVTFPAIDQDVLREYVNEYKNQRTVQSLKGVTVQTAVKGIVSLIMNKQAGWNKSMAAQSMSLDTFGQPIPNADVCGTCHDSLIGSKVIALKCRHRFHAKCVRDCDWCPSCGKYTPSPDEYPELS